MNILCTFHISVSWVCYSNTITGSVSSPSNLILSLVTARAVFLIVGFLIFSTCAG